MVSICVVYMNEIKLATDSYELIRRDFGLTSEIEFEDEKNAFKRLEEYLTEQINDMLDHDFNQLLNALYRIDIAEVQVKKLLHESQPKELGLNLARAIIEREKQKVITREQYRSL